jgi:hypothetical protein
MSTDVGAPSSVSSQHPSDSAELNLRRREAWLRRMLPWMIAMVFGLTIFFFAASAIQLSYLHYEIKNAPTSSFDLPDQLLQASAGQGDKVMSGGPAERLPAAVVATLGALERSAMARRYHQANVLLLSRVWTSYLGFVTGMVLAMVGAIFVLGRLEIATSSVDAKVAGNELSFKSSSPGLLMALFGVALMMITIVTHHDISVEDRAIYTQGWALGAPPSRPAAPPAIGQREPDQGATDAGVAPHPLIDELKKNLGGTAEPEGASLTCPPTCNAPEQ